MKYVYAVAQIVFIGFATANLIQGNVQNCHFYLILSFLMAILWKLEGRQ